MAVRPPGFGPVGADLRERARGDLLDTALRLFVERGYIGVRVEDIAKAAGISRATFYKHFSEREEILAELFARLLGRGSRPPVLDMVDRIIEEGAAAGAIRPDIPPALITAHIARSFEAAMRDWAEGLANDVASHLMLLLDLAFQGVEPALRAGRPGGTRVSASVQGHD